jgi:Ca2+-binding RTX toxin-like protein
MTTITATNSAPGFDMYDTGFVRWSGTALYSPNTVVFGYDADDTGESTYAPQRINIYGNDDFTYDGVGNPAGGYADLVNINIDNSASTGGIDFTNDIAITADTGTFWPLTFVAPNGTNEYVAADRFWSTLLSGDDTILAPRIGSALISGDFHSATGTRSAGNDTFSVSGSSGTTRPTYDDALVGDSLRVESGAVLVGGADSFALAGVSIYNVYGDTWSSNFGSTVIGGDDTIVSEANNQYILVNEYERPRLVGDARYNDGRLDGGDDTITGSDDEDVTDYLVGDTRTTYTSFNSRSLTNGGNDHLIARAGDDTLTGDVETSAGGDINGGADIMSGGAGDDFLVGDLFNMNPGHYHEPTILVGGNDLIDGDDGTDTLVGDVNSASFGTQNDSVRGGNDTLRGGAGNDVLYGDVRQVSVYPNYPAIIIGGDDWLDGGAGRDTMLGGGGNDVYVFDDVGDQADETGGDGIDTIYSYVSVDFTTSGATGDVENLTLLGTAASGFGNGLGNVIVGNDADNTLKGKGGDDFLRGGLGKDKLIGNGGIDTADYGDKTAAVSVTLKDGKKVSVKVDGKTEDTLKGVEHLIGGSKGDKLGGDGNANALIGNKGKDSLAGGKGDDTLTGGNGADHLRGDGGKDVFVFAGKLGGKNADTIADFKHDADTLALDDALFAAIGVKLNKGEFYAKAGAHEAHDASDHIIYNKSNGRLYYDADGKDGLAAQHFATLSTRPSLDHGDFAIV